MIAYSWTGLWPSLLFTTADIAATFSDSEIIKVQEDDKKASDSLWFYEGSVCTECYYDVDSVISTIRTLDISTLFQCNDIVTLVNHPVFIKDMPMNFLCIGESGWRLFVKASQKRKDELSENGPLIKPHKSAYVFSRSNCTINLY